MLNIAKPTQHAQIAPNTNSSPISRPRPPVPPRRPAHRHAPPAPGARRLPRRHLRRAQPGLRGRAPQARPRHRAGRHLLHRPEGQPRGRPHHRGRQARHVPAHRRHAPGAQDPRLEAPHLPRREGHAPAPERANGGLLLPVQARRQHLPKGPHRPQRQGRRHEGRHLHLPAARMLLHPARKPAQHPGAQHPGRVS